MDILAILAKFGLKIPFAYPARFSTMGDGKVMVMFRDVPDAMVGPIESDRAHDMAAGRLAVALGTRLARGLDVPRPTKPHWGERLVFVRPDVAMRLGL